MTSSVPRGAKRKRDIPHWYYEGIPDTRGVAKAWGRQATRFRLEQCRAMLYLHGILTEGGKPTCAGQTHPRNGSGRVGR